MRSTGDCGQATGWGRLETRDNALNALRLALAIAVLVSHSMIFVTGTVSLAAHHLGAIAVGGFFAISGFLVTGSRERLSFLPFVTRRALRIFPGYWVVLIVTAFVFAPLVSGYDVTSAVGYVSRNWALLQRQLGIGETLQDAPGPAAGIWNGSLWTLPYEFAVYLGLGVLFARRVMRRPAVAAGAFVILSILAFLRWKLEVLTVVNPSAARFALYFSAGVVLRQYRTRIPASSYLAAASAAMVVGLAVWGPANLFVFGAAPVAYGLLWLGTRLSTRLGNRHDVSYGVYIYAHPVQQLLASSGATSAGVLAFSALTTAATLPFAWCSWLMVERPAMQHWRGIRGVSLRRVSSTRRGPKMRHRASP